MMRVLDITTGAGGGAAQLARTAKQPRNIHVTVKNLDTVNPHCAYFGRSRRELGVGSVAGTQQGFALPVGPAAAAAAGNGVQYAPGAGFVSEAGMGGPAAVGISSFVLQGWAGELWACADATGKVIVDVFDSATPEA